MTKWKYDPKLSPSENRRLQLIALGKEVPEQVTNSARAAAEEAGRTFDDDLVPDVLGERSEVDVQIDQIVENIEILDAYQKWIGKEVNEKESHLVEGQHVSCPNPGHRDKNPSCWLNKKKKTWYCGGCDEGGDIYDLAAIKFNYPRPEYKTGKTFHDLRRDMAEAYGLRTKKTAGGEIVWTEDEDVPQRLKAVEQSDPSPEPTVPEVPESSDSDNRKDSQGDKAKKSTVVSIDLHREELEELAEDLIDYPLLDWRKIVPEGTFLSDYLEATCNDDSPEEYHFWHGLLAVGHAAGRDVYLNDTPCVYGNLLLCLLGGTGYGKSKSRRWLTHVLREALPWNEDDATGTRIVPTPASGEQLITLFEAFAIDPRTGKNFGPRVPVNGLVDFSEFSGLLAKANRMGAYLKEPIMDMSDGQYEVTNSTRTAGTSVAIEPYCSITSTTQPKAVRPLLSKFDLSSGFLNRWLFIGGPRKKREVLGGIHSSTRVDLDPAVAKLKNIRGWAAAGRDVYFPEGDARDEWIRWNEEVLHPLIDKDDTELLARINLTMKRIILLFCINERKTEVDEDIVERAKPILDYLIKCYSILNAEIGITQIAEITAEIERHVARAVSKTGRGLTVRDLRKNMRRKNYSPELIMKALETMVKLDILELEKPQGPGRPAVRYKLVAS